jgi:hypothetical protein
MLEQHNKTSKFIRYASNDTIQNETKSLIKDHFNIAFVEEHIDKFVDELYDKCKEGGILREFKKEPEKVTGTPLDRATDALKLGKFQESLALIDDYLKDINDPQLSTIFTSISAAYNLLLDDMNKGILRSEEINVRKAEIVTRIQEFINKLKQREEDNH